MAEHIIELGTKTLADKEREIAYRRDFDALAEFTHTASFSYNDIHNEKISTISGYDFTKVINNVSKAKGWTYERAKQKLIDIGVLKYLPNGEFAIDVHHATRNGGGCNFAGGVILFNFDVSDAQVMYHEYAHSLQKIYEPFNDNKLRVMYANTGQDFDKVNKREVEDYFRYLNEMHSETFAYAALMLRAKNMKEFAAHAMRALEYGMHMTINGKREKETEYGTSRSNSKYYASYHVMKKTIREILKLRLKGKQKEFFDENGILKYQQISELAANIVEKSAYSPRQFVAFKKHALFNLPYTKKGLLAIDHGYQKDVLDSIIFRKIVERYNKQRIVNRYMMMSRAQGEHMRVIDRYTKSQMSELSSPIDTSLPQHLLAFQSIDKIHAGMSVFEQKTDMNKYCEDILRSVVAKRFKNKDFSDESRAKDIEKLKFVLDLWRENDVKDLDNFLKRTDEVLKENINNPYFERIMEYSEHSFYQQIKAKEQLQYNPGDLYPAPVIRKDSPYAVIENEHLIKYLIELGVNLNSQNDAGATPLMLCKTSEKAKIMLEAGANPDIQDNYGQTALMYCKTARMAKVILEHNPSLELRDYEGKTALHNCDNPNVAKLFIDAGMNVNAQDYNSKTVLMYNKSKEFVEVILNAKQNPNLNLVDNEGKTALHHCEDPEIAKLFIDKYINVNAQDNDGNTALMLKSDKKMIKTILDAEPNLDIRNNNNENALMVNMTYEKTKLLIDAGIDVNATDNYKRNALMKVIDSDKLEYTEKEKIINKLLKSDIDVKAKDAQGNNALVYVVTAQNLKPEQKSQLIEKFIMSGVDYKEAINTLSTEEDKKMVKDVVSSIKQRAKMLSDVRKKLARGIDNIDSRIGSPIQKVIGKKLEDVKLPKTVRQIEALISYKISRNRKM